MTTYHYVQVSQQGYKRGACVVCGTNAERQQTFTNTVNPFNRNEDGSVKTRAEVAANVKALVHAWQAEPIKHARCES